MRHRLGLGIAALLAVLWAGCSGSSIATTAIDAIATSTAIATATVTPIASPTVIPTPTATPAATATLTPAPSSTPTPLVTPTPLAEATPDPVTRLSVTAFAYLKELTENHSPRESATGQELAAAEYLSAQFASMGFSVELQPFTVELLSEERSGLSVDGTGGERLAGIPLTGSARGEVSGILVSVGLALEQDIPAQGLEGSIALAQRGAITFEEKVRRATDAGAIGVVVYNNEPGNFRGTLGSRSSIPVIGLSQEDGQRLERLISAGQVAATLTVAVDVLSSRNVIAEKPGPGPEVVLLGGHYDTVANVPGATDNGSGIAVLLTIAQELQEKSLPFGLRFVAFGSEELGLNGSRFYVDSLSTEERRQLLAMLNFDALGIGRSIQVLGSSQLTGRVVDIGDSADIAVSRVGGLEGATSDHASFNRILTPNIMFASDDFSQIHTPNDNLDFVEPRLLGDAAALGLALLDTPEFWLR